MAQALRRNPVAIVIPCHRVIGSTGHLTGYAGGLERQRALLAHEGVPLVRRAGALCIDKTHMYVGWRAEGAYCKPQCPTLAAIPPGDMLLVSPAAVVAQRHLPLVMCVILKQCRHKVRDTRRALISSPARKGYASTT